MLKSLLTTALLGITLCTASHAQLPDPRVRIAVPAGEQPITLQRVHVSVQVRGGLAETTVHLTLHNPNPRVLEGNLEFPLLPGQQITGFALDIDGELRPAVPVPKAKGREVFESIERRNVDPGLLEQTAGNQFRLRVYPIAAQGTRTVELRYSEALPRDRDSWRYTLPLAYAGTVPRFTLTLDTAGATPTVIESGLLGRIAFETRGKTHHATLTRGNLALGGQLRLWIPAEAQPKAYTQRHLDALYLLGEIPLPTERQPRALPRVVGLLWDSSGSGAARNHALEYALLQRYFAQAGAVEVRLTRLRDRPEATETFRIRSGDWQTLKKALQDTVYDGASALAHWQAQADVGEYLLFSDGLANFGGSEFPRLSNQQRLFAIHAAVATASARLQALAERHGGRLIALQPDTLDDNAAQLLAEGWRIASLDGEGISDLLASAQEADAGMLRIAGRLQSRDARVRLTLTRGGQTQRIDLPVPQDAAEHPLAARLWATYRLQQLALAPELHRAEMARLGQAFGLVTPETSLIVLDRVEDYVEHGIVPPASLLTAYQTQLQTRERTQGQRRDAHLQQVLELFEERQAWWSRQFPKGTPPIAKREPKAMMASAAAPPPAAPAPAMDAAMARESAEQRQRVAETVRAETLDRVEVTGSRIRQEDADDTPTSTITLRGWTADAPYIARLQAASPRTVYAVYLDIKPDYRESSGFYLDAADILLQKGQRALALRVLSNLAEMAAENRALLRILGYRLLQADESALAIPVFQAVQRIAEEEPQSFRDLGLAYAAAGQPQAALQQLYQVVTRPWDGRFAEIELIALTELNAIAARHAGTVDTAFIDPRLLRNLPLDLRVVLTWDADNTDMDLWVTDPNGEKSYYSNRLSYQGGRMSDDFTGGYGPEEFALRVAKPGTYTVEVDYFGSSQQVLAGATTLQVTLTTGFGTRAATQRSVTLRLSEQERTVFVGEFEVSP